MLMVAAACTVRPLYATSDATTASTGGAAAALSSIAIEPVDDRVSQEVRNALIFRLHGGRGEPTTARYNLRLNVLSTTTALASRQITTVDQEPTARIATLTSSYELRETTTRKIVSRGSRAMTSSFDVPVQQFAADRAERDAENRAARELAELLRLAIAQDLERLGEL